MYWNKLAKSLKKKNYTILIPSTSTTPKYFQAHIFNSTLQYALKFYYLVAKRSHSTHYPCTHHRSPRVSSGKLKFPTLRAPVRSTDGRTNECNKRNGGRAVGKWAKKRRFSISAEKPEPPSDATGDINARTNFDKIMNETLTRVYFCRDDDDGQVFHGEKTAPENFGCR